MIPEVHSSVNFPELEQGISQFWSDHHVFERSLALSADEHVFYDGPPFPTGAPHHGTILVSVLKDALARYFTMAGKSVPRVWGWDCHGLPIETAVEKRLGIEDKRQIEGTVGIGRFNDACRELVQDCDQAWEAYVRRIGRWVDYHNAYRTLDKDYMESVLWVFEQSYRKGLIYKDYRVTPYCCRCETSLSFSDAREADATRPREDPTVVVKFRSATDLSGRPTYFLAWTTTPWTLPANLALAAGRSIEYAVVDVRGEHWVLATEALPRYASVLGERPHVVEVRCAEQLAGMAYEPLMPYFRELQDKGCFRLLPADFVTTAEGTGLVHTAPAFGEDDYWLCREHGLPVRNPVDSRGCFTDAVADFAGRGVLEANRDVVRLLDARRQVVETSTLTHNYPHCWRCRQPLIYRAMDAWYFRVTTLNERMLELNEQINWVPETVKHGRFGNWLRNARDWNISRNRYWGMPVPVWECDRPGCEHRWVPGSCADIAAQAGRQLDDLHREHLDAVAFPCACGHGVMRRVPEVLDCWFESAAMPFAQCHYPFENREWFEAHFPADFIVEYPGQIRGWFYYLHVLATALLDRPAFKNCVVHGTLLDAEGRKLSKSSANYTDPMLLMQRYGADALRGYLLNSPAASMADMQFDDDSIEVVLKQLILPLWNAFSFFVTYANIDGFTGDPAHLPRPRQELDRWLLARLAETEEAVRSAFESYQLCGCMQPVQALVDDLTDWYIRRSRRRFWSDESGETKRDAYETLYCVLVNVAKLLAPITPFLTETIYRALTPEDSVHLSCWPRLPADYRDADLLQRVRTVRNIASLGLSLRTAAGIKVRQPLATMSVVLPAHVDAASLHSQLPALSDELNVKHIEFLEASEQIAAIRAVPNARRLGPRYGADMQTIIRAAREGRVKVEGDDVLVFAGERTWRLDAADISIGYQGRPGRPVAADRGVVVALDTSLTEELVEEGIANELNRRVQTMRKEAGYHLTDPIVLQLDGTLEDAHRHRIAGAALAELGSVANPEVTATVTCGGREFRIALARRGNSRRAPCR